MPFINEMGNRHGKLVVVKRLPNKKDGSTRWECLCDCGNAHVVIGGNLRGKHNKSCGCHRAGRLKLGHGVAAYNAIFGRYKNQASRRHLNFELTEEQFRVLTQDVCHYCGTPPKQEKKSHSPRNNSGSYFYNGIDRKDNNVGYTIENCVTCCGLCNQMKMGMGYAEFIEKVTTISNLMQKRGGVLSLD